ETLVEVALREAGRGTDAGDRHRVAAPGGDVGETRLKQRGAPGGDAVLRADAAPFAGELALVHRPPPDYVARVASLYPRRAIETIRSRGGRTAKTVRTPRANRSNLRWSLPDHLQPSDSRAFSGSSPQPT